MMTLESLRRRVEATEDLQSVVRTMKALAAVNIRQFEEGAIALQHYRRTVELGLRAVLRHARSRTSRGRSGQPVSAAIVIGSDQGMCGQFNEEVADHALHQLSAEQDDTQANWRILAVGERLDAALQARGRSPDATLHVPGSVGAVTTCVRQLLATIEDWQAQANPLREVLLVYNGYRQQNTTPVHRRVLPLDEQWLQQVEQQPWPTRALPLFRATADVLLSHLVQQYLFAELHGAVTESLTAENATRLRAMQAAEKNVDERLEELTARFNRQRQNSITAELLDVISGSEAVAG